MRASTSSTVSVVKIENGSYMIQTGDKVTIIRFLA